MHIPWPCLALGGIAVSSPISGVAVAAPASKSPSPGSPSGSPIVRYGIYDNGQGFFIRALAEKNLSPAPSMAGTVPLGGGIRLDRQLIERPTPLIQELTHATQP